MISTLILNCFCSCVKPPNSSHTEFTGYLKNVLHAFPYSLPSVQSEMKSEDVQRNWATICLMEIWIFFHFSHLRKGEKEKFFHSFFCFLSTPLQLQFQNFRDGQDKVKDTPTGRARCCHTETRCRVKSFASLALFLTAGTRSQSMSPYKVQH